VSEVDQSSRPEPLVRPPRLHLGREGTASRLELFFDLAYVLVVLELAKVFYEDLTWHGAAVMAGLFVTIWLSWVSFTLYANRFDTDDVVFRIAKLVATGSIAGCAASASDAAGKLAVPFAACYLGSLLVLLALYLRAWRHVQEARPTVGVYLLTVGLSAALWAVSLIVPSPARYLLWAIAVLVSAAGPVLATLRSDRHPLQIEHLPERFALLVILVLGEAVGSAARGVHDASWAPVSIGVGVLAFGVAAGMWWIYFDITAPSSARELHDVGEEEDGKSSPDAGDTDSQRQRRPARPIRLRSPATGLRHRARRGWSGAAGGAPGQGCSLGRRLGPRLRARPLSGRGGPSDQRHNPETALDLALAGRCHPDRAARRAGALPRQSPTHRDVRRRDPPPGRAGHAGQPPTRHRPCRRGLSIRSAPFPEDGGPPWTDPEVRRRGPSRPAAPPRTEPCQGISP
jgi:Bacterial low temperature requirement A protein (LtrA)